MPQEKVAPGNTRKRAHSWCFTLNNPQDTYGTAATFCMMLDSLEPKTYIFQLEKGEEKGVVHYQGVIQFPYAKDFSVLQKMDRECHWSKCKNLKASQRYCQKEDTRIAGPWSKGVAIEYVEPKKEIVKPVLREWQSEILERVLEEPDERTINWYWENVGGIGKTWFCKYLVKYHDAVYVGGKSADIKHVVANLSKPPKIVIWDLVRSLETFVSYEAVEAVKNGIFMSGKYESKTVCYDCPHVICFANFPPDLSKLSKDRWRVVDLNVKKLDKYDGLDFSYSDFEC